MLNEKLDSMLENIFLDKIIHKKNFCNIKITSTEDSKIELNLELFISRKFVEDKYIYNLNIKSYRLASRFGCFTSYIRESYEVEESKVEELLNYYVKNDKENVIVFLLSLIDSLGIGYDDDIKNIIKKETKDSYLRFEKDIETYSTSDKGYEIIFCY